MPADVNWPAGGNDLPLGVDQYRFEIVGQPVGPAKFLHIARFHGGKGDAGKTFVGIDDAARQRIAVTTGVPSDVGPPGCGIRPIFDRLKVRAIFDVDLRRREIGRDETLVAVAIENDQVAHLRHCTRVPLGDVFPAFARLPGFPAGSVVRKIQGGFAEQDVDAFKGAGRVLGHHDAEVLEATLVGVDVALPGKNQVSEKYRKHRHGTDQRDKKSEGFRLFLSHQCSDFVAVERSRRRAVHFDDLAGRGAGHRKTVADEEAARLHFSLDFFPETGHRDG